jgi:hypothetical protein
MTSKTGEFFSIFKQNCMLKVDPKGTTAAAVTYAGTTRGMGSRPKTVTFAHTFYMVIHYLDTILFVAKIGSPTDLAETGDRPAADTVQDTNETKGRVSAHFAQEEMALQQDNVKPPLQVCMAGSRIGIQVIVKLHDGKDDQFGTCIEKDKIVDVYQTREGIAIPTDQVDREIDNGSAVLVRTYTVPLDDLIRVRVKFPMPKGISKAKEQELKTKTIKFTPVYVAQNGGLDEEAELDFTHNDPLYELPFPLQKEAGEEEDGWLFKDENGNPFLKLRFHL